MKLNVLTNVLLALIAICLIALIVQNWRSHTQDNTSGVSRLSQATMTSIPNQQTLTGAGTPTVTVNPNTISVGPNIHTSLTPEQEAGNAFQKIVGMLPLDPITFTNEGCSWGNGYIRTTDIRFDVRKTDSVITPFAGYIIYRFKFGNTATACLTNNDWDVFFRTTFQWRNGRWFYEKTLITDSLEHPLWDPVDVLVEGNDNINFSHKQAYRIFGSWISTNR
jgi:hypothetical protein